MATNGLCEGGCGNLAPIATKTNFVMGYIKGQPKRFIHNHHAKGKNNGRWLGGKTIHGGGYVWIMIPGHPRANRYGYVFEHVLLCEKALGKPLPAKAVPHHFDGDPANNKNSNLVLCQDQAYHNLLEARTRALKECGHASWRKCYYCHKYDDLKNLKIRVGTRTNGALKTTAYHKNHSCKRLNSEG